MLDRQSSQVRIGDKISASSLGQQSVFQEFTMPRSRLHDDRVLPIQPGIDKLKSGVDRQRILEQAWAGGEPEKGKQDGPGKSACFWTGQYGFEP